jgi:2'-5' RNA ligase
VRGAPRGKIPPPRRSSAAPYDARTRAIEQALDAPCELHAFDLEAARIGVFPAMGRPRVFWVGVAARGDGLARLHQQVSARLALAGVPPDDRPFQPHLTLGRVREGAGLRVRQLLDGLTDVEFGRARVTEAVLFEGRPSKDGPAYVARARTRLLT